VQCNGAFVCDFVRSYELTACVSSCFTLGWRCVRDGVTDFRDTCLVTSRLQILYEVFIFYLRDF
jgi:hypothetical protein